MLPALLASLTWMPALVGLGALLRHDADPELRPSLAGFFGLAVAGLAALVVNFAVAVGPWVSASIWATGCVGCWLRRRWLFAAWGWTDLLLPLGLLALSTAGMPPPSVQYDTGLYHLQAVKWLTSAPLIPGLANLARRLGYDSLWLATLAALEHPLAAGRSAFFASQLPIAFMGSAVLTALRRLLAGDRRFPTLFLAAGLLPLASASIAVGGDYADYPVALLVYLALSLWADAASSSDAFARSAYPAALLTGVAVLFKLSAAPLALCSLGLLVARRRDLPRTGWARLGALAVAAGVPWALRSVLLSGCVVYPAAATCLQRLPWSVPARTVTDLAEATKAWSRAPLVPQEVVLASWAWIEHWPTWVLANYPELWLIAGCAAVGVPAWLLTSGRRERPFLTVFGLSGAALAWWFATAPDPRFALGQLYAAALAPLLHALHRRGRLLARPLARVALVATLLAAGAGLAWAVGSLKREFAVRGWSAPLLAWPEPPEQTGDVYPTAAGVSVFVPDSEQCWAAPIPCAPATEFDPALRLSRYFSGRPR